MRASFTQFCSSTELLNGDLDEMEIKFYYELTLKELFEVIKGLGDEKNDSIYLCCYICDIQSLFMVDSLFVRSVDLCDEV